MEMSSKTSKTPAASPPLEYQHLLITGRMLFPPPDTVRALKANAHAGIAELKFSSNASKYIKTTVITN